MNRGLWLFWRVLIFANSRKLVHLKISTLKVHARLNSLMIRNSFEELQRLFQNPMKDLRCRVLLKHLTTKSLSLSCICLCKKLYLRCLTSFWIRSEFELSKIDFTNSVGVWGVSGGGSPRAPWFLQVSLLNIVDDFKEFNNVSF